MGIYPADIDLVWPDRLVQPPRPPALVYLDLNHWIDLERAQSGAANARPGYTDLLRAAESAVAKGRAMFPLSAVHYLEMSRIAVAAQRARIATLMLALSRMHVLIGRVDLARLEIEGMLDALRGERSGGEPVPLLGRSGLWAFGRRGGLLIEGPNGTDGSETVREAMGAEAFEALMETMNTEAEYALLRGPSDVELSDTRASGYRPEETHAITERRAEQEREQAARLEADPRWRIGRLRDVIGAREMGLEWIDAITYAVLARGTTIGEAVGDDRDTIRRFSDGMPSSRVAITLKTRYHADGRHRWTANDINDIDALAVAVAYCDAVLTDKAAWNALNGRSEILAYGTALPRRPGDLTAYLDALPQA